MGQLQCRYRFTHRRSEPGSPVGREDIAHMMPPHRYSTVHAVAMIIEPQHVRGRLGGSGAGNMIAVAARFLCAFVAVFVAVSAYLPSPNAVACLFRRTVHRMCTVRHRRISFSLRLACERRWIRRGGVARVLGELCRLLLT